ncbi:MAG TPA: PKD domain-containing protein, partial [Lentimicrobium sp.]|nr:PKD domain-containing protein [Lentimicrobium sp.]
MRRGTFSLLLLLSINLFAQKEYSNWYFGDHAGLSFNSGNPLAITTNNCNSFSGSASVSDSLGNLLFYTDGEKVYNKFNYYTPNGTGLYGKGSTQGTIILQKPGSNNLYYIINVFYSTNNIPAIPAQGLFYSVFNMELDGGLGDIDPSQKNIPIYLPLSGYACDKLTSVKHKNNKDIWIITRSYPGNKFYSFLLTSSGISNVGLISPSLIDLNTWQQTYGEIAISPDGKRMAAAYSDKRKFEYGSYNIETGKFNPEFVIQPDTNSNGAGFPEPYGLEFSPDSKLLYYCMAPHPVDLFYFAKIQQYDALSPDSASFKQSEITIGYGISGTLQTGLDAKIYGGLMLQTNISVIGSPNKRADSCNFQYEVISLADKKYWTSLPQMIQKYFAYFNVQHLCANQPVEFTSNIWPLPESVYWNFGDAASGSMDTSSLINPAHVYSSPGNYEIKLIAYWPGDRSDTTIKSITIGQPPNPALGEDKEICIGGSTTLTSATFESYQWVTGDTSQSIIVADTGVYWVEVTNAEGCIGRDSVRVDYFAPPILNTDSLVISPTTCGGSRGAITGLTV